MKKKNIHQAVAGASPMVAVCGSRSGLFAFSDTPITCVRCLARKRKAEAALPHHTELRGIYNR